MSKWKRAKERNPKSNKSLLFITNHGDLRLGCYDLKCDSFNEYHVGVNYNKKDVLVWCYVPEYDL